ncbi:MAG: hypothetical protein KTR31_23415 [Myxococcales bacterium]|nr:hypothetical protein [Myxococcales bacterium]
MDGSWVLMALASMATNLPVVLVWVGGIIVAGLNLQTRRRGAILALCGLIGSLVLWLVMAPLSSLLPPLLIEMDLIEQLGLILGTISFLSSALSAVMWGLLIAAVFVKEPTDDDEIA